jgi:hypothetical protein
MNKVDAGRDRATQAPVRHNDDEPLTPISPCYGRRWREPLGMLIYCSVKLPRETPWSFGNSTVPAVQGRSRGGGEEGQN